MRTIFPIFFVSIFCSIAPAQEPRPMNDPDPAKKEPAPDAKTIMLRADEAIKKVFYVSYDALFQGTGFMVNNAPTVKGKTVQRGKATEGFGQYRFDVVSAKLPWGEATQKFVSGYDGRTYYLFDPDKKIAYVQSSKEQLGPRGRLGDALGMQYFAHPEPFADDLSAPALRIRGDAAVGDQECWEIAVTYADPNKGKGAWFISKKDYLPRRRDLIYFNPETQEVGSMQWILTNLSIVSPKENDLTFVLPAGYTESKDPAP